MDADRQTDQIIAAQIVSDTLQVWKAAGWQERKSKVDEMRGWSTPFQFYEKARGKKFGQMVARAQDKLQEHEAIHPVGHIGFVHPITREYPDAFAKCIDRARALLLALGHYWPGNGVLTHGLLASVWDDQEPLKFFVIEDEDVEAHHVNDDEFVGENRRIVQTDGNGRLLAINLALDGLMRWKGSIEVNGEVCRSTESLLALVQVEGREIRLRRADQTAIVEMLEEIRKLSGAYFVCQLEEGQGDAMQARSGITHRVGTCDNGENAWAWNPLQAKLEGLASSPQCEGYGRVSNPQQRQVTWLEAIAEWQKYGVLEYLKEKKPSLCNSCAKDDEPSKKPLCGLHRFGQQGQDEFRCDVYVRRISGAD